MECPCNSLTTSDRQTDRMNQLPVHILARILSHVDQGTRVMCMQTCSAFRDAGEDPGAWPDMTVYGDEGFRYARIYRPHTLALHICPDTLECGALPSVQHLELSELYPQIKTHFPNITSLKVARFRAYPADIFPPTLERLEVSVLSPRPRGVRRLFRSLPSTVTTLCIDAWRYQNVTIMTKLPPTVHTLDILNAELLDISFGNVCRSLRAFNVIGSSGGLLTIRFFNIGSIQEWSMWVCQNTVTIPSTALIELDGAD